MHTPEPWRQEGTLVYADGGTVAAMSDPTASEFIEYSAPNLRNREGLQSAGANARRIASCVNACRGIADPETAVPALVAAARLVVECGPTDEEAAQATADGREDTVSPWLALRAALAAFEPVEDA